MADTGRKLVIPWNTGAGSSTGTSVKSEPILAGSENFSNMLDGATEGTSVFNMAGDPTSGSSTSGYQFNMFKEFNRMREENSFCDVILFIGPERSARRAHRAILAAFSEYFRKMLEPVKGSVDLKDFDAEGFDVILDYIYSGKAALTKENAYKIAILANYLNAKDLLNECCSFLKKFMNKDNCVELWKYAEANHLEKLKEDVKSFIVDDFEDVKSYPDLMIEMEPSFILELVSHPGAVAQSSDPAKNEQELFNILYSLLTTRVPQEKKNAFTISMLEAVHLPQIAPEFLTYIQKKTGHIPEVKAKIDESRKAKDQPDPRLREKWYLPRYKSTARVRISKQKNAMSDDRQDVFHYSPCVLIKGHPWVMYIKKGKAEEETQSATSSPLKVKLPETSKGKGKKVKAEAQPEASDTAATAIKAKGGKGKKAKVEAEPDTIVATDTKPKATGKGKKAKIEVAPEVTLVTDTKLKGAKGKDKSAKDEVFLECAEELLNLPYKVVAKAERCGDKTGEVTKDFLQNTYYKRMTCKAYSGTDDCSKAEFQITVTFEHPPKSAK